MSLKARQDEGETRRDKARQGKKGPFDRGPTCHQLSQVPDANSACVHALHTGRFRAAVVVADDILIHGICIIQFCCQVAEMFSKIMCAHQAQHCPDVCGIEHNCKSFSSALLSRGSFEFSANLRGGSVKKARAAFVCLLKVALIDFQIFGPQLGQHDVLRSLQNTLCHAVHAQWSVDMRPRYTMSVGFRPVRQSQFKLSRELSELSKSREALGVKQ